MGPKEVANKSGSTSYWLTYWKLRNYVTRLKQKKNKRYYEAQINCKNNDGKNLSTLK